MASLMPSAPGGESFQSRLNLNEPFTQAQLLGLVAALGDALRDAHRQGRFHGAITPADLRYDEAGELSLVGWGRDITPDVMQSSAYAAIERYVPVHPPGPWTDVYAIAAILWRAITGGPPAAVLHRKGDVTLERLAPSGYDPRFLQAVDEALVVAPQRRPRDIDAWLAMLTRRAPAGPEPGPADPAAVPGATVAPSPRRASRWRLAALAAGIVAAVGGGIYLAPPVEPRRPAPSAPRVPPSRTSPAPPAVADAAPRAAPAPVADPIVEESPRLPAAAAPAPSMPPPAAPRAATAPATQPAPVAPAPVAVPSPAAAEAPIEPPIALLKRADARLRDLYADYDRLNLRIARSYRSKSIPYATKQQTYRESRRIQAALIGLRDDRNRIAESESFAAANRRYDALAEDATRLRDRIEMLRRTL